MFDSSCIFCKIIQGQMQANIVKENDYVIAIHDIAPKAPVHILLIPKIHIVNLYDMGEDDAPYAWHLLSMARDLGNEYCGGRGFNLVVNNGADAGQRVFHLHIHVLSGKKDLDGGLVL